MIDQRFQFRLSKINFYYGFGNLKTKNSYSYSNFQHASLKSCLATSMHRLVQKNNATHFKRTRSFTVIDIKIKRMLKRSFCSRTNVTK